MSNNLTVRQDFSPSCPSGGTWWACGHGTFFVGCCARDPCDITCAAGNLYPGAFDPNQYGKFPDATCGTGSKFYTCTAGKTFWGCCKTNPCAQGGCPDGDLENAILNRPDLLSAYHATGGSTTITSASATSSPTSTGDATASSQPDSGTPVAVIAGGAAGGAFAIAAIVGILLYFCCFKKRQRRKDEAARTGLVNGMTENGQQHANHVKPIDAPPSYNSPNSNVNTSTHNLYSSHAPPPIPHDSQYMTYAHRDPNYAYDNPHAPHYHHQPQELALTSPTTATTPLKYRSHKSMYGHVRGPSELSGEQERSELSSGPQSPDMRGGSGVWKGGGVVGGMQESFPDGAFASTHDTGVSPMVGGEEDGREGEEEEYMRRGGAGAGAGAGAGVMETRRMTFTPPHPPPTPYYPSPHHVVGGRGRRRRNRSREEQEQEQEQEDSSTHGNWMAPRNWDSPTTTPPMTRTEEEQDTSPPQQHIQPAERRRVRRKKRMDGPLSENENEHGRAASVESTSGSGSSGHVQGLGVVGIDDMSEEGGVVESLEEQQQQQQQWQQYQQQQTGETWRGLRGPYPGAI